MRDRSLKMYGAYTSHMDHCIGQLIETVKRAGRLDSTIIIFASDNGAPLGDPNADVGRYPGFHEPCHNVGSNGPLRAGKATLYEGGIRTPAAFQWQGQVAPGRLASPAYIGDWMPTFAEMLGAAAVPRWDGRSLWRALTAGVSAPADRTIHWNKLHQEFAVRRGDWKLIHRPGRQPSTELFNIAEDPVEQHEVSAMYPSVAGELRDSIEQNHGLDDSDALPSQPAGAVSQSADDDP